MLWTYNFSHPRSDFYTNTFVAILKKIYGDETFSERPSLFWRGFSNVATQHEVRTFESVQR